MRSHCHEPRPPLTIRFSKNGYRLGLWHRHNTRPQSSPGRIGLPIARKSMSLLGRTATSAMDAAALGGVAGFNEGNGLNDRATRAGEGALAGGLVGGALPVGFAAAKGVVSPFLSNIIAQLNPEGVARRQVARAIVESGEAPNEIARALQQAQVEGQGNFTVADALGNAGQRMPSTVARAPGEGRTAAVNFLENRQAGQGRRVSSALAEGFDTRETAEQTESRLTQARNDADDAEFAAVRNDAKPVIGKII